MARLNWRGDEVARKVRAAAKRAVDETNADAVDHAKRNHRWRNRTGTLEGGIQMRPAVSDRKGVVGQFGVFGVTYGVYLELLFGGKYRWLNPAADATWPGLADRIRRHYESGV